MAESSDLSGKFIASLRSLAETLVALLHNRLELLAVEGQELKIRLAGLVVMLAALVVFGLMTVILLTFMVVAAFWDHRLIALAGLTLLYGGASLGLYFGINSKLKSMSLPFAATLAELRKDRACLRNQP